MNDIPKVFENLEEMARQVDCAMLHGCNWDFHAAKALPFLERDKSVFIDKPLAGNAADLATIAQWASQGRRVAGGSSLLYCQEAKEWRDTRSESKGILQTVFCGCGVDLFNYGIHAYALASALAGAPVTSVRHVGSSGRQASIELVHADGMRSRLQVGPSEAWLPFYATVVTTRQVSHFTVDTGHIYASALDATLPFLDRRTEVRRLPLMHGCSPKGVPWPPCSQSVKVVESLPFQKPKHARYITTDLNSRADTANRNTNRVNGGRQCTPLSSLNRRPFVSMQCGRHRNAADGATDTFDGLK